MSGNGRTTVEIGMATVTSSLTMKGLALPRLNDKDSCDIDCYNVKRAALFHYSAA